MDALDLTAIVHLPQALFWGVYWLYSSSMPLASRFATIVVAHDRRVFSNLAARGKTSVDWFFGFKLHLVVNECGELLNFTLTPGNIDDRKPVLELLKDL
jgi:hypothetical protein